MRLLVKLTLLTYLCLLSTSCATTPTPKDWPAADSDRVLERLNDGEEIIFQAPYDHSGEAWYFRDPRQGSMLTLSNERIHLGNASLNYAEVESAKHMPVSNFVTLTFFEERTIVLRLKSGWGDVTTTKRLHQIIENKILEANQIRERIQKGSLPATTMKDINRKVAEEMRRLSLAKQQNRRAEINRRLGVVGIVLRNRTEDVTLDRSCKKYGTSGGYFATSIPPVDLIIFIAVVATSVSDEVENLMCEKRSDPRFDAVGEALMESLSRVRAEGSIHRQITRLVNRTLESSAVELPVSDEVDSIRGKIDTLIELEPIFGIVQTTGRSGKYIRYSLTSILGVRLIRVKDNHILDQQRYEHVSESACRGEQADCNFDEPLKQAFSYFGFRLARDLLR